MADWVKFPDWEGCFQARMELLRRLGPRYPDYASALTAANGEQFVVEVSKAWSTDPQRAGKVLALHDEYKEVFVSL
jgi:flagellum-specific peptidoglycan hydrolase FlgJ